MGRFYRVGEFAGLTGVSVRTLHHYDRIGLLQPAAHSESGYRLYAECDLLRLQQVLTLRYLGFPLKQIRELLGRSDFDLVASIHMQRGALRERISELERIESSLGELIEQRLSTGEWAWDLVAQASAAVQDGLEMKGETMNGNFTPEQMKRWEELGKLVPPEEIKAIEQGWTELLTDVRANRDLDPASPQAQTLADRWNALTEQLTRSYRDRGFGDLLEAVGENYKQGSYVGHERAPQPEDFAFIQRVNAARGGPGQS